MSSVVMCFCLVNLCFGLIPEISAVSTEDVGRSFLGEVSSRFFSIHVHLECGAM